MVEASKIAAHTLLNKGVRFPIRAPWFIRLFGKKEIGLTITRPYYGVSLYLSLIVSELDIDLDKKITIDKLMELKNTSGLRFSHAVAAMVLNSYWLMWLVKPAAFLIRAYAKESDIVAMLYVAISLCATQDFMTITDLMKALVVTEPPEDQEPGQNESGS